MTFTWNDVVSSTYSIIVTRLPQPQLPEPKAKTFVVPGRAGNLTIFEGGHEPVKKTVDCILQSLDDIDDIFTWLQGSGTVIFSDRPDMAFRATILAAIPTKYDGPALRAFSVNFECQPYAYQADPDEDIVLTVADEITNPGSVESEPVITIVGSGDISLTIGSQVISLSGVGGSITIDSEKQSTYDGTTPLNSKLSGDYPVLPVGETEISWTGTVTSITIKPNWRWLG